LASSGDELSPHNALIAINFQIVGNPEIAGSEIAKIVSAIGHRFPDLADSRQTGIRTSAGQLSER
jgi:hypothetical protein